MKKTVMLRLIYSLVILLILAISSGVEVPVGGTNISNETPGLYSITNVYDGDTIGVEIDNKKEKVRLIGVDTPETNHPRKPVECFGKAATSYTTNILKTQKVRLELDPNSSNRDRYDRLLRYVWLQDGRLLNRLIIEEGYGFAYTHFPFEKMEEFRTAEKIAREKGIGLWSVCDV